MRITPYISQMTTDLIKGLPERLPQWRLSADELSISRTFVFADFAQAFAFMTRMAEVSERLDHHPEWRNVYNRVEVTLTTHDAGGLTEKDVAWAEAADGLTN